MSRVEAVRVACIGEARDSIKDFENYNLPTSHEIFTDGEPSQLAHLVGIPLIVKKIRPSRLVERPQKTKPIVKPGMKYGHTEDGDYFPNAVTDGLMMQITPTGIFPAPEHWRDRVGSVLVARSDGRPLHAVHIVAVLNFLTEAWKHFQANPGIDPVQLFTPQFFKIYYPQNIQNLILHHPKSDTKPYVHPFDDVVFQEVEQGGN